MRFSPDPQKKGVVGRRPTTGVEAPFWGNIFARLVAATSIVDRSNRAAMLRG